MKWKQNMVTIFCTFRFYSAVVALQVHLVRPTSTVCPYKNSQRSYGRPRKNAYLEICWLDSAFKIFQQFKFTGSAGVLIWVQVRSSLLRRFESSRRSLRNLYSIWCPIFGSLLQISLPLLEISLTNLFIFRSRDITVENRKCWHSRFLSENDASSSDSMFPVSTAGKFIHFNKWQRQQGAILPVYTRKRTIDRTCGLLLNCKSMVRERQINRNWKLWSK